MLKRYIAEFLGTFALVFAGTGAIIINDLTGGGVSHVGVALTFGLVATSVIYAVGDVSGAHLNPAVTFGFWSARRFPGRTVLPYIVSQCSGAVLASVILKILFAGHPTLGATLPAGPVLATPFKNNLYWHEERDDGFFLDMARRAAAEVMIYGHTHIPYRKDIEGKVFINAGSVGKPKDGDPRARIAVVEILPGTVKSEFIRVPYDVDKTAAAVRDSGLPAYFAEKLKEGK